jgi:hypothetical protein
MEGLLSEVYFALGERFARARKSSDNELRARIVLHRHAVQEAGGAH